VSVRVHPTARLCEAAGVDAILVGDSLGMVVLGYPWLAKAHISALRPPTRMRT
jgi:ketopantoate hydroxymethyltransferase